MPKIKRTIPAGAMTSADGSDGHFEPLETDGSASISFVAGSKEAPTSFEAGETDDEKRARITDRDLVWPGKTETVHIGNPENIDYRFDLTVTDLDPALYVKRPPVGGLTSPLGGVVLGPNEQAKFEITFLTPTGDAPPLRNFSLVLTMFDVRRTTDPGEIVDARPLRWVPLPKAADLQVLAEPHEMIVRPWRRSAAYQLRFANKSYLPPTVELRMLRAETKEALAAEAESVGSLTQALPARTSVVWKVEMGPFAERTSYYATAVGKARVADRDFTINVAKPVHVKYVPWLKVWKDWAFLGGAALVLFWAVWGFPVVKRPVVNVPLSFGGMPRGKLPAGMSLTDLSATMLVQDQNKVTIPGLEAVQGAPGRYIDPTGKAIPCYVFTLPARWCGFRWAWGKSIGWNSPTSEPQYLLLNFSAQPDKAGEFSGYDLDGRYYTAPASALGSSSDTPEVSVLHSTHLLGDWTELAPYAIPRANGVRVVVPLDKLSPVAVPAAGLVVNFYVDGQALPALHLQPSSDVNRKLQIQYDLLDLTSAFKDGSPHTVTVAASSPTMVSNATTLNALQPQSKAWVFHALTFTPVPPSNTGVPGLSGGSAPAGGGGVAAGGGKSGGAPLNTLPPPAMPVSPMPIPGSHALAPPAPSLPSQYLHPNPPAQPTHPVINVNPIPHVQPVARPTIRPVSLPSTPVVKPQPIIRPVNTYTPPSNTTASTPSNGPVYDAMMRGDYATVVQLTAGASDVPSQAMRSYALFEVPGGDTNQATNLANQVVNETASMPSGTPRAYALLAQGRMLWAQKRIQEGINSSQQAESADPNLLWAKVALARVAIYADPGSALHGLKAAIDQAQHTPADSGYVKPMKSLYKDLYQQTE